MAAVNRRASLALSSSLRLPIFIREAAITSRYKMSENLKGRRETRACSLEDQQHHHIDKDSSVGSSSPRADKRVATLDEIMAASKSGQCAIVDMVTRLPLFSKSVQAPRTLNPETGYLQKRQKEHGKWRDS
ncbi:hypothetical protein Tco_0134710 [Tanacetum coccineum]